MFHFARLFVLSSAIACGMTNRAACLVIKVAFIEQFSELRLDLRTIHLAK
jgi:hypothetical protein